MTISERRTLPTAIAWFVPAIGALMFPVLYSIAFSNVGAPGVSSLGIDAAMGLLVAATIFSLIGAAVLSWLGRNTQHRVSLRLFLIPCVGLTLLVASAVAMVVAIR